MGSWMPFPLAGGEAAFTNPPQTAADALATTTETTNQKQSPLAFEYGSEIIPSRISRCF